MRRDPKGSGFSFGRLIAKGLLAWAALTVLVILVLRWIPPPTSAFMLRAEFAAWREGRQDFSIHQQWVELSSLPPATGLAMLAAEDQSFAHHHGFNFSAIAEAFKRNLNSKRMRGGSTLSQQTAKNLFLSPSRSLMRKALEAGLTVLLELLWPKSRILEVYLNIAQFGDGIYGVESASRTFFGKPAARLEPGEAALLAAVLPNPLKLRVDKPTSYVLRRRDWILRQMRQLGEDYYPRELHP